jgi:hypothetical protein
LPEVVVTERDLPMTKSALTPDDLLEAAQFLRAQQRISDARVLETMAELMEPNSAVKLPDRWIGETDSVEFFLWKLFEEFGSTLYSYQNGDVALN